MDLPSPREPYVATIANLAVRFDAELYRHDDRTGSGAQAKADYAAAFARYDQARADDTGRLGIIRRLVFTADQLKATEHGSMAFLAGHICDQAAEVLDIAGVEPAAERADYADDLDEVARKLEVQAKACRDLASRMRARSPGAGISHSGS